MRTISKAGLGVAGVLALLLLQGNVAGAHPQAQGNDVVGVGSDTVQYGMDFLMEGDPNGHQGWNTADLTRRVYNYDATGDACGNQSNQPSPYPATTAVLRAGSRPVTLPNGSGGGLSALNTDTGAKEVINYVRASRLPNSTEENQAVTNGWGGLHVYQFATDNLQIATRNAGTNAPSTLTVQDLVDIYDGHDVIWSDVPGYDGPAPSDPIHAKIPQSGSGTRNFFLTDLELAATGGSDNNPADFPLATSIANSFVQEHDPFPVSADADAIEPFSTGRFDLLQTGYCAGEQNLIKLAPGTGTGLTDVYQSTRGLYIVVRQRDVADTTGSFGIPFPWLTGGTQNWVQALFSAPTSWMRRAGNAPIIQAAGLQPGFIDCGVNPTTC